jgi:DnaJ family protein C protein 19
MSSAIALGLGALGAGFATRYLFIMLRASKGGADKFLKGGFKTKMDKSEALQVLALRSAQ